MTRRTTPSPLPFLLALLSVPVAAFAQAPEQKPAPAAGTDALYEKVFGKRRPAAASQKADLPVLFDGTELGQVPGMVSLDPAQTRFDVPALVTLLRPLVQTGALDRLAAQADADGTALPARLDARGIQVSYEGGQQILRVHVPANARRVRDLAVMDRGAAARAYTIIPQADFSAQMNMRGAVDYLSAPVAFGGKGWGPVSLALEPAMNWKGWVLEGEAYYQEDADRPFARGPVRLVHDLPEKGVRVQMGDLSIPVAGNQIGRAVAGLSVAKNFSIRPYDLVQPAGNREFVLENPAVVEVLVNGRATRVFRLAAGPYNLNSFPGAAGTNDVRIRITDAFGREQVIDFPFFFDSQLLGAGIQEYGYTLGVPSSVEKDLYRYDEEDPVFSGYHRVGISDQLTLGMGTQINRRETSVTAEALFTTPLGTFGIEPSAYLRRKPPQAVTAPGTEAEPDRLQGIAGTLRYRSYGNGEDVWDGRSLTAQVSWYDEDFRSFGALFPADTRLDAALRLTQPLLDTLSASLGGRYLETRSTEIRDSYGIDLSLRQRVWTTGSLDVTFSHGRNTDGSRDTGLYLSLRFLFDDGRQMGGVNIDTISRQQSLDWRYQSLNPVNALNAGLSLTNESGRNGDRLEGDIGYVHQRFEVQARHDLIRRALNEDRGTENRTQLAFATSLVHADGHTGVSRPVTNSFAIITPHPRLKGRDVGVDPVDGRYLSQTDTLGPPVVPNISAYLVRPLLLDVPDAPANYDLGNDRPAVQPSYRVGIIVPIGTDAVASLTGQLQDAAGEPAALQSGVLRPVDAGPDAVEIAFFTNRRGTFRVEGVRPGKWSLQVHGLAMASYPVTVDRDAEGDVRLGTIRLPGPGASPP